MRRFCVMLLLSASLTCSELFVSQVNADEPPVVRSRQSGLWSAKETWDADRIPKTGDRVVISAGHLVNYNVDSTEVIRLVQIAGTLEFARDRSTRLEAGLVTIIASEEPSEEGFDCHFAPLPPAAGKSRPALLIGKPGSPIPATHGDNPPALRRGNE